VINWDMGGKRFLTVTLNQALKLEVVIAAARQPVMLAGGKA
jgi:hypothetical protein